MSDLPKQLRIKAGMISMGERIAWGSDSALMEQAAALIEQQQARIAELEVKTSCCMGVGNGNGRLFVYGNHESIKTAQRYVLEREELAATVERLRESINCVLYDGGDLTDLAEAVESTPQNLNAVKREAIESFKDELIKSVNVIFRPHIEGVCAVLIERYAQSVRDGE